MRWPQGAACALACGSVRVSYMPKRRRWYCNDCKGQFTAKTRMIFEDSPIGFAKWLPAIGLIASNRNGISSNELARGLGVTQRTAWFMLHRIRAAMETDATDPLRGIVGAGEANIGGPREKMNRRRRRALEASRQTAYSSKQAVFGMVERGGRVRPCAVRDTKREALLPMMRGSIHHDATLYTGGADFYTHINEYFLNHSSVNHSLKEYVRGIAHTNNTECFCAVLKRTAGGTYTHVDPRHLDRYLAEQVFRFDERENEDGPRFAKATQGADGTRLTYKALTHKPSYE